jgi:hypothetical protein
MRLSQGEVPPPFWLSFQEVFLWLGPIDRVCVPSSRAPSCVTSGGSRLVLYSSSIFAPLLSRYSKANIPRRDPWLDLLSLFIKWTTYLLHTFCHADLLQPHFSVLETSLRSASHPHNTPQMLFHASSIRCYLPRLSTIPSHALIASSTSFVCTFFFFFFGFQPHPRGFPVLAFWSLPPVLLTGVFVLIRESARYTIY